MVNETQWFDIMIRWIQVARARRTSLLGRHHHHMCLPVSASINISLSAQTYKPQCLLTCKIERIITKTHNRKKVYIELCIYTICVYETEVQIATESTLLLTYMCIHTHFFMFNISWYAFLLPSFRIEKYFPMLAAHSKNTELNYWIYSRIHLFSNAHSTFQDTQYV